MSILISPDNNTGWGTRIGTSMLRATGSNFSYRQPVRVRPYYRAQWGQLNASAPLERLRKNLRKYAFKHRQRLRKIRDGPKRRRKRVMLRSERAQRYNTAIERIRRFNRLRRAQS